MQAALASRPLHALAQQVGRDADEDAAGAPTQRRPRLVVEVGVDRGDHRFGDLRGAALELVRHDSRAVGVEPTLLHRPVQAVQACGLRPFEVLGWERFATAEPHRRLDATPGLVVGRPEPCGHEVGGVDRDPAGGVLDLAERAVLEPHRLEAGGFGDRDVLEGGQPVHLALCLADEVEPLVPRPGPPGSGKPVLHVCHRADGLVGGPRPASGGLLHGLPPPLG